MHIWDASLNDPAADLAADEALLNACEAGGAEVLRFWEPSQYFVVLGFSNQAAREANLDECRRQNVPVLRRCSGGGAVLQGPGCLNYTLILRINDDAGTHTISAANGSIMERNRAALANVLGQSVTILGVSDLCLGGRKFSGNAQRRLRHALIFHGTFLLNFDLARVETFLATPSRQPEYRASRSHREFITNTQAGSASIKKALREAWGANEELRDVPDRQLLVKSKYSTAAWNLRF